MDKQRSSREVLKGTLKANTRETDKFRTFNVEGLTYMKLVRNIKLSGPAFTETPVVGKVVVATRKLDEKTFELGISYCSPYDNFDRLKGQVIALGRMTKSPIRFERIDGKMVKTQVAQIVVDIAGMADVHWMAGVTPEQLH